MSEECNSECCEGCPQDCCPEPNNQEVTTEIPTPKPAQDEDPTAKFDVTRTARQEALEAMEAVLSRASRGSKIDGKELKKAFRSLFVLTKTHNDLCLVLMRDLYRLAMHLAQSEMNLFAIRTHLKAVVRGLERKGVITQAELEEIHDKEIVIEELPEDTRKKMEEAMEEAEKEVTAADTAAPDNPSQTPSECQESTV